MSEHWYRDPLFYAYMLPSFITLLIMAYVLG